MGQIKIGKFWIRNLIFVLIILSLFLSVKTLYAGLFYVILLISGALTGRIIFLTHAKKIKKSKKAFFSWLLLSLIVIIILVAPFPKFWSFFYLITAGIFSYHLHQKKLVGSFKSKDFIK